MFLRWFVCAMNAQLNFIKTQQFCGTADFSSKDDKKGNFYILMTNLIVIA